MTLPNVSRITSTRRAGSGSRLDTQMGDEGQGGRSEPPAADAKREMPGRRRKISKVRMRLLQHAFLPAIHPQAALERYDPFRGPSGPDPVPPKRLRGIGYFPSRTYCGSLYSRYIFLGGRP